MHQPQPQKPLPNQQLRINKYIAERTTYSRRKADELVTQGRVFINNRQITTPGELINPDSDQVRIDKTILSRPEKLYFALNKPRGYVTTLKDESNRQIITDLLPKNFHLKPVGRLDKESEGLIFLSNDGEFIYKFTHPKFQCEKEYSVKTEGQISQEKIKRIEQGVMLEGRKTAPAKVRNLKTNSSETSLQIIIHEGRNRQIRKMFALIGHPVKYLQRIRIGQVKLGDLKPGKYRRLTKKEIDAY